MYATPYFANKLNPAVIISFVTTGNAFPVNEDHLGPESLLGYVNVSRQLSNIQGNRFKAVTTHITSPSVAPA